MLRLRWILLLAIVVRVAFPLSVPGVHGDPGVFAFPLIARLGA